MNKTQPYLYQYPPKTYINAPSADTSYEEIIQQIEALDRQNKKLVSIAENIMKTSFIRQTEQTPAVILQL